MNGTRIIQGSFQGGRPRLALQAHSAPGVRPAGTPSGARPGAPRPAPVAQPFRDSTVFQVPPTVNFAAGGAGQPLPPAVLQKMESFFGASFADVRVHVGPQAGSIGALAFTMGSDLYFAPGQYSPHSAQGQRLLGHELTHVVQQRAGRVRNPLGNGVAVVQDPALEAEAERMGMRVGTMPAAAGAAVQAKMPGGRAAGLTGHPPGQHSPAGTQRTGQPAGASVQAYLVQPGLQHRDGSMQIQAIRKSSLAPVGSVMLSPRGRETLQITDLEVAVEHRRRGVGTMLVQAALKVARGRGVKGTVLEARPVGGSLSQSALVSMYRRLGFETVGTSGRGSPIMACAMGAVQPRVRGVRPSASKPGSRASIQPMMKFFAELIASPYRTEQGTKLLNLSVVQGEPNIYKIDGLEAYIGRTEVNASGWIDDERLRKLVFDYLEGRQVTLYRGVAAWHPGWQEQQRGIVRPLGAGKLPTFDTKKTKFIPFTADKLIAAGAARAPTGMGKGDWIKAVYGYTRSPNFVVGAIVRVTVTKSTPLCFYSYTEVQVAGPVNGQIEQTIRMDTTLRQLYGMDSDQPISANMPAPMGWEEELAYRRAYGGMLRQEPKNVGEVRYRQLKESEAADIARRARIREERLRKEAEHRENARLAAEAFHQQHPKPLHDFSSSYIS